jgi:hypothetical protein
MSIRVFGSVFRAGRAVMTHPTQLQLHGAVLRPSNYASNLSGTSIKCSYVQATSGTVSWKRSHHHTSHF